MFKFAAIALTALFSISDVGHASPPVDYDKANAAYQRALYATFSLARCPDVKDRMQMFNLRGHSLLEAAALSGRPLDEIVIEVGRMTSRIIFMRERNNSVVALCEKGRRSKIYDRQQLAKKANQFTLQTLNQVRQLTGGVETAEFAIANCRLSDEESRASKRFVRDARAEVANTVYMSTKVFEGEHAEIRANPAFCSQYKSAELAKKF